MKKCLLGPYRFNLALSSSERSILENQVSTIWRIKSELLQWLGFPSTTESQNVNHNYLNENQLRNQNKIFESNKTKQQIAPEKSWRQRYQRQFLKTLRCKWVIKHNQHIYVWCYFPSGGTLACWNKCNSQDRKVLLSFEINALL